MLNSRFAVAVLAVAALLFVQSAAAQTFQHKIELFAEGGVSFSNQFHRRDTIVANLKPLDFGLLDSKISLSTSPRLFAGVRFWLDDDQAVEASYSFSPTRAELTQSCSPNCGAGRFSEKLPTNFFAGNYVHTLPKLGDWRPFLTSGIGVMSLFEQEPGCIQHAPLAMNVGGGFDRYLAPHWGLRAEFRDWMYDMPHLLGNNGLGLAHNIVPSLGPVLRF